MKPASQSPSLSCFWLPPRLPPSPTSLLIRGRSSVHTLSLPCLPPSLNSSHFLSPVYTPVTMIDRCSLLVNEHFPPHKLLFHVTRLAMPFKRSVGLKSSPQVFLPSARKCAPSFRVPCLTLSLNLKPPVHNSALSLMHSSVSPAGEPVKYMILPHYYREKLGFKYWQ